MVKDTYSSSFSAMANGLETIPGDEMDVDMDIDLGPIDVFPEGDLDELVRGNLERPGGSSSEKTKSFV